MTTTPHRNLTSSNSARRCVLLSSILLLGFGLVASAQIPATLQMPVLGYLLDQSTRSIRPISGILGNSRIEESLQLEVRIDQAVFLADQRYAIVSSPDSEAALLLNLATSKLTVIAGTASPITSMCASTDGSKAALYYAQTRRIQVVSGLPSAPVVRETIDLSVNEGPLTRFAISEDGEVMLLSFSSGEEELLYAWTSSSKLQLLAKTSKVSDIKFSGSSAVVLDAGVNQVLWIRDVRQHSSSVVVSDAGDGISHPIAVDILRGREMYIANAGNGMIVVLDLEGHIVRRVDCDCVVTTIAALRGSAFRLTEQLDRPVTVLDGASGQVLFIPALSPPQAQEPQR